jgi:hypothetical protein
MKTPLWLSIALVALAVVPVAGDELDYGDRTSATLTGKAWKALGDRKYADAVAYARKCVELYEKQAIAMQAELDQPVPPDDREAVARKWALNDVGTCLWIMGQGLEKQDRETDALAAYKQLRKKVPFAQCWDPKGWYWKPADAAKERIVALELDSEK